jgi:hypothetical protein
VLGRRRWRASHEELRDDDDGAGVLHTRSSGFFKAELLARVNMSVNMASI